MGITRAHVGKVFFKMLFLSRFVSFPESIKDEEIKKKRYKILIDCEVVRLDFVKMYRYVLDLALHSR